MICRASVNQVSKRPRTGNPGRRFLGCLVVLLMEMLCKHTVAHCKTHRPFATCGGNLFVILLCPTSALVTLQKSDAKVFSFNVARDSQLVAMERHVGWVRVMT
jgi:hypothetical protein